MAAILYWILGAPWIFLIVSRALMAPMVLVVMAGLPMWAETLIGIPVTMAAVGFAGWLTWRIWTGIRDQLDSRALSNSSPSAIE